LRLSPATRCTLLLGLVILATCFAMPFADGRDNSSYLRIVADILQKNYFPARMYECSPAAATFTLNCNGSTENIKIVEHPFHNDTKKHARTADSGVVCAIKNSSFPKTPPDFQCPAAVYVRWKGLNVKNEYIPCTVEADGKRDCDSRTSQLGPKHKLGH
jgi:hypothetical protein